jgi:hypothetical protein
MIKNLIFIILIFICSLCYSQFITRVTGKVIDGTTNQPIENATVIINNYCPGTSYNLGVFNIDVTKTKVIGNTFISFDVSKSGYTSIVNQAYFVSTDGTLTTKIILHPNVEQYDTFLITVSDSLNRVGSCEILWEGKVIGKTDENGFMVFPLPRSKNSQQEFLITFKSNYHKIKDIYTTIDKIRGNGYRINEKLDNVGNQEIYKNLDTKFLILRENITKSDNLYRKRLENEAIAVYDQIRQNFSTWSKLAIDEKWDKCKEDYIDSSSINFKFVELYKIDTKDKEIPIIKIDLDPLYAQLTPIEMRYKFNCETLNKECYSLIVLDSIINLRLEILNLEVNHFKSFGYITSNRIINFNTINETIITTSKYILIKSRIIEKKKDFLDYETLITYQWLLNYQTEKVNSLQIKLFGK